jgi:hydroxymethylglutaryl-CoA lyase
MPETDQAVPSVEIVEVSPRDGLQNESRPVSTADKVRLIEGLVAAGVRRMEATSFVHPGRVPQMSDAEDVMAAVPRPEGVSYIGLVLNQRGAVRAAAAGVHELNYVVPCTDTFGQRNQGVTTRQALDALEPIAATPRDAGLGLSVTLAVAFGCPYEGEVHADRVAEVSREVVPPGSTSWRSRTRSAAASRGR